MEKELVSTWKRLLFISFNLKCSSLNFDGMKTNTIKLLLINFADICLSKVATLLLHPTVQSINYELFDSPKGRTLNESLLV